jgi:SpoVK/Ycf46/Vps4 family AAA+-type ATPase
MDALGGNYKFRHLKVFGSVENLYENVKKYRRVYDEAECKYIYAELAFFNKLFDEKDWEVDIKLVCKNVDTETAVCELKKRFTVKKEDNLFNVREGWGTPNTGWWKSGKYIWEAYINEVLVGSANFFITNGGLVSETSNPYVTIRQVRLFESDVNGMAIDKRKYLQTFSQSKTRYINIEMTVDILKEMETLPMEFQFNFYNDAGQHKAYMEYFTEIKDKRKTLTFDTGYGSSSGGYWFEDKYSLEIIFMDQLIGVVPFTVGPEDEELLGDMSFKLKSRGVNGTNEVNTEIAEEKVLTYEEATAELKALIGLGSVKDQIDELATYLKFIQIRKEKGFKENSNFNLHTVFMGNPGTGKTTVAKLLGQIYHSLGLLSKGHVHEVGRVDLVGEYIGQTAPKVQKAIEKARGGILFVDEAYALSDRGDDGKDFGKEAIEVFIKEMSDGKGDIAIVFAGYPKEMNSFIGRNPGMKSRIQSIINFPDYTPDELMEIARYSSDKRDVNLNEDAWEFLSRKIYEAYRTRDDHFGNGRFINGVIEECKQNMALRLMKMGAEEMEKLDQTSLSTVSLEDVEKTFGVSNKANVHIPIDMPLYNEALNELHSLVGLDEIKRDVDEMAKLVRYYTEIGRDVKKAFSLHTVFVGNPGTGKTTVARILVKIYKALGVLERGQLIETDRKGLVAGYTGQTAIKTDEMIQMAMGGGLFIDEAYALTEGGSGDFGKEAVDTLLKRMEDQRGQFMVIVAGYPDEMRKFLESNPGLMSRFDRTLKFTDYDAVQLFEIAENMFENNDLYMNDEAGNMVRAYIDNLLAHKHKYFGNARTIRKIVEEVVRRQNLRLANILPSERTHDMVKTVTADDLKDFHLIEQDESKEKRGSIGFNR